MGKLRILFVDDEPNVLRGLRRMLRNMRTESYMDYVEGGQEALELMEGHEYDVIVSDMRMPGINGVDLLRKVMESHPEMVRLILSGQSDERLIRETVGVAHQFLSKPCSPDVLRSAVREAVVAHVRSAEEEVANE